MSDERIRQTVIAYVNAAIARGETPVLRRSLVESFLSCRAHVGDGGPNAQQGSLMHDAIARLWKECVAVDKEMLSRDRVLAIADEAFDAEPRGLPPLRRQWLRDLLLRFSETHAAGLRELMRVEHTGATLLDYPSKKAKLLLTGTYDRLDRIDDDDRDDPPSIVRVVDYKTEPGTSDHEFQMQWYASLVCHEFPSVVEVETEIDLVAQDGRMPTTQRYSREELEEFWLTQTTALLRALDAGEHKPTGGRACQYCALRLTCAESIPPFRALPENDEQMLELFGEWVRVEAREDELRAILAAYTDGKGRFVADGFELGWLAPRKPRFEVPIEVPLEGGVVQMLHDLWRKLEKHGLDPNATIALAIAGTIPKRTREKMLMAGDAIEVYGKATFKRRLAQDEDE